jgi:hypothetical protein
MTTIFDYQGVFYISKSSMQEEEKYLFEDLTWRKFEYANINCQYLSREEAEKQLKYREHKEKLGVNTHAS